MRPACSGGYPQSYAQTLEFKNQPSGGVGMRPHDGGAHFESSEKRRGLIESTPPSMRAKRLQRPSVLSVVHTAYFVGSLLKTLWNKGFLTLLGAQNKSDP